MGMLSLDQAKHMMRAHLRGLKPMLHPDWGDSLADLALQSGAIRPGDVVAGFWPFPWEIDIRPLLFRLHESGHPVLLPETPRQHGPLIFREWSPGVPLLPGPAKTFHPDAPERRPDLILTPMLAFDRRGHRLGYGAGYYDRTLSALETVRTIGCAYSEQEMASVPSADHDQRLDAIVTEREFLRFR